jgi:hypothetical protein
MEWDVLAVGVIYVWKGEIHFNNEKHIVFICVKLNGHKKHQIPVCKPGERYRLLGTSGFNKLEIIMKWFLLSG